jgi:hypothetical protein
MCTGALYLIGIWHESMSFLPRKTTVMSRQIVASFTKTAAIKNNF